MSDDEREGLRARIRETSKDEVILEEMIRRGFWRENAGQPSLPGELIKRQGEVRRELEALAKDTAAYTNPERALKLLQAERMKEARERRVETKQRHARARHERALAWHKRQSAEITHLGDDLSAALHGRDGKPERLASLKLPVIADCAALAEKMGIKLGELRFLAYDRKVAKVDHYARFTIPKKSGGVREISAPMPRLKRAQYWILGNILEPIAVHDAAHGFRARRSIMTNAAPHAGRRVVINIDLKDFFPSITYGRVKGFFVGLGYPERVAAPLALICTDAERDRIAVDGHTWNVARGQRRLPQGAPTSPAIANLIANRLDGRMLGAARKLGLTYTRYADDMTFSGDVEPRSGVVGRLLWQLRKIAEAEGFTFNDKKTRVMGAGSRQDVTGLVVNKRPAVARDERRRFRAWLHKAELARRAGTELPAWTNAKGVPSDGLGFAGYLAMVDPEKCGDWKARTKALYSEAKSAASARPSPVAANEFRKAAAQGRAPSEKWWTPAERPAPQLEPIAAAKTSGRADTQEAARQPGAHPSTTSVPNVQARNTIAETWRASQPAAPRTRAEASGGPGQKRASSFGKCLIASFVALPLLLVPVIGPVLFIVAMFLIWRGPWRGKR
jgi:nitrate reductase NapE component